MIGRIVKKIIHGGKGGNGDKIMTLVSEGTSFEGKFTSTSSIRIEGFLKGDIQVDKNLIVGETGKVIGNVNSSKLIVFGTVEGKIKVQSLKIHRTANIKSSSEAEAETVSVESGAVLDCKFSVGNKNAEFGSEVTKIDFTKQK